jgi:hypothetical protein
MGNGKNIAYFGTILICTILGPLIGLFFYGIFIQHEPRLIFATDIGGVPLFVYALITAGPFGAIIGVLSIVLGVSLLKKKRPQLINWLLASGFLGTVVGSLLGFVLFLIARQTESPIGPIVNVGALSGLMCGVLVGCVWRFFPPQIAEAKGHR